MTKEDVIRAYYSGYEKKEWGLVDGVLADGFTFTSPNNDDHINAQAYKERCWPHAEFVERFELETVRTGDFDALVKYVCCRTNGTSFGNVEYFRFAGEKIASIEVYFGAPLGYPSASASGKP